MRNKKKTASITAGLLSAAILLTGTFAWRSISQQAKNEIIHTVNPGGRLHDDFDGESKDVYVENFMKKGEGGQPIFARIRLDEYMEKGKDAGTKIGDPSRDAASLVTGAKIDDVTTWKTHIPGDATDPFHDYWEWYFGGETVFMPTFNKNKDSLYPDVNGTWEGKVAGDFDHFDDHVTYTDGQTVTGKAYYDADDNADDENYDPATKTFSGTPGAGGAVNVNYREADETHTAKKTLNATVMTMADWKALGSPMGPYWVYDVDGWAYWAQAIQPGEATGLLLDGIEYISDDDTPCYYGINVVGQFATKDEWKTTADGKAKDGDDFFDDTKSKLTDDARFLLKQALGLDYKVTVTGKGGATTVPAGTTLDMTATLALTTDSGDQTLNGQAVTWSLTGNKKLGTKIDKDTGKLTVDPNEPVDTVLTVQAKAWNREVGEADIKVTAAVTSTTITLYSEDSGMEEPNVEDPNVITDPADQEEPGPMEEEPNQDEALAEPVTPAEPAGAEDPVVDESPAVEPEPVPENEPSVMA